ncbi:MAG: methyltransferase domain-containing protein [Deltaproteobacteria bacterium]|nr:methyltransferase domain-containing protein [Deltaproteobacteria bacterium]
MDDKVRDDVSKFYGAAAEDPMESLCCAPNYDEAEVAHIPKKVLDISYGCGSPISLADIKAGEVVADLGSGGGIDCFIAAKLVGKSGRVIGVDMTAEMLKVARETAPVVAENLGYDIVEFEEGFLEDLPIASGTVDIVTSNCVLNLSPDKGRVFLEIYRALKPNGRFCITDVVSEVELPEEVVKDKQMWGECLSGALTEDAFKSAAKEVGFKSIKIISKTLYRETKGLRFNSITMVGSKTEKDADSKAASSCASGGCC